RKSPGFTTVAILTLALGIGANTAIFTLVNALLLRDLAVVHPQQLVQLSPIRPDGTVPFSYPMFREVARGQQVFSGLIAWSPTAMVNVEVDGTLAQNGVQGVTGDYFSVLGVSPFLGRLISSLDANFDNGSSPRVAVLSYAVWRRRFGASPDVIGKQIRIENQPFAVIGVTQRWFTGMTSGEPPEIIIPFTAQPLLQGNSNILQSIEDPSILWLYVVGRLKEKVTLAQAQAQLQSFWLPVLETTAPTHVPGNRLQRWLAMKLEVTAVPKGISPDLREQFSRPLYVLLGVVGLILLASCVNLASLMLARTAQRSREMSIRLALGAKPSALVRQTLTECLTLSFAGAVLGAVLAYFGSTFLAWLLTRYYMPPVVIDLRPELRVLAATAAVAVLAGILFGLAPAFRALNEDPVSTLQRNSRGISGGAGRVGKALVIAQIALSFTLLLGAGLLLRTFQKLCSLNLGFTPENLLEVTLSPMPDGYRNLDMTAYHQQFIQRLSAIPGVRSVAFSDARVPGVEGWRDIASSLSSDSSVSGPMVNGTFVSPRFLQTLGVRLLAGRDFRWNDDEHHTFVVVISRSLSERLFPGGQALGQHIRFGVIPDFQSLEIVGVADNARLFDLRSDNAYVLYFPSLQHPKWARWGHLYLRGSGASSVLSRLVTHEADSLGHEYVLATHSVADITSELLVTERAMAILSVAFAALAVLLACVGLYGLMSYGVTRRTNEIGIRATFGAQQKNILWMVLREAVGLAAAGILLGIPCSLAANRLIASMLFGVSASDPSAMFAVVLLLLTVSLFAAYLPARRAMRVDPMVALRYE
ncbi:MAG TPA: ABC transporter permease, partial [Candidatus Sulfotelmatobacter sp.]|nr:ABC transporter permease [Candidatus Sulfotelmatobacter sp.]